MANVFLTLKSSAKTKYTQNSIKLLESNNIPFERVGQVIYLISKESFKTGVDISSRVYDKPYSKFCMKLSDSTFGGSISMGEGFLENNILAVLKKVFGDTLYFEFSLSCNSDLEIKRARIVFNEDDNSYELKTEIDEEQNAVDYVDCKRCGNSHPMNIECDCSKINTQIVEPPKIFKQEIDKIRALCNKMEKKDIDYVDWADFFIKNGYKAKLNIDLEISANKFKFRITNKNNKHLPLEINFIEGKFAGWLIGK